MPPLTKFWILNEKTMDTINRQLSEFPFGNLLKKNQILSVIGLLTDIWHWSITKEHYELAGHVYEIIVRTPIKELRRDSLLVAALRPGMRLPGPDEGKEREKLLKSLVV